MRVVFILFIMLALAAAGVLAADGFTVRYLSAENVYLDSGEADGLIVGAKLIVLGTNGVKAELEVVYVAAHSASCKVIGDPSVIQVGDKVRLKELPPSVEASIPDTIQAETQTDTVAAQSSAPIKPKRAATPISGSVSMIFYHWNDNTEPNLDFTQTTARLSLKARRLWGREITFAVRGRGRFDKRVRDYRAGIEREDWQNRIWEFSLAYEEPTAPVNLYAGRILPRRAGGVGYLDGLIVEGMLSEQFRVGAFGGSAPDWMYDDRRYTLMKGGGYFSFSAGAYDRLFFDQSIGLVGEYHSGETNREFLVLQGRLNKASTWGLYHTAEFEINRGWRKERAGRSFELSNIFLNWWVRPSERLRFSLSYDNRTNYWTYDTRTTVDSLFDDNLRQGARFQSDLSLPGQFYSSGSFGYRKRDGDPDPTWSYSAQLRKANAFIRGLSLSAQYAGFDGPTNRGYNYSLRGSRLFGNRYTIGVGYGSYAYRATEMPDYRTNNWVELSGQADISRHYWLGLLFQTDSGDDIQGYRVQSELGYRF